MASAGGEEGTGGEDTSMVNNTNTNNGANGPDDGTALMRSSFRRKGAHEHHPFFSYYGLLVHQQNMMQDTVRTGAYQMAIVSNPTDFHGKVVLDVGTGSGILAFFAAKAGARKVYAVEASDVADRARTLMATNGMSDIIEVIKGKVEEIELPEKVDVIISEPMGFMLIHERMLESYMIARQLFLKPDGKMYPTTGTIYAAPFTDQALWQEQMSKVAFWHNTDFYGLDLTCLAEAAVQDHFAQPVVGYVEPTSLLSATTASLTVDFSNHDPESLHKMSLPFDFTVTRTAVCHGLAAWFDVAFLGSDVHTLLDTGPTSPGTHWYQCRLLLKEPIAVNALQRVTGVLYMIANAKYSYNLVLTMALAGSGASTVDGHEISSTVAVNLQDQMYHYLTNPTSASSASGHSH